MFRHLIAFCAAFGVCLSGPSLAQSSFGLGEINPWGTNYLKRDEQSLPTAAWQNSDPEILADLLKNVQPHALNPLQRALVRRALLSPARAPVGEDAAGLLSLRAKLIYELGEAKAAADLMGRIDTLPDGFDPEEIEADLKMALGQESSVCGRLIPNPRDGAFWARTRVVCAILTGDNNLASLTLEFASMQGINDPWLFQAINYQATQNLETANPPTARFDSGVNLALSLYLDLPTPINAVRDRRKELAAILAARNSIPSDLRTGAAKIAYGADLITTREFVLAYDELAKDLLESKTARLAVDAVTNDAPDTQNPESQTTTQDQPPRRFPRDATEKALLSIIDEDTSRDQSLNAVIEALRRANNDYDSYRATAILFDRFIRSASTEEVSGTQYLELARAALALGDTQAFNRQLRAEAADRKAALNPPRDITVQSLGQVAGALGASRTSSVQGGQGGQTAPVTQNLTAEPQLSPQLLRHLEARAFENARLSAIAPILRGPGNTQPEISLNLIATAKSATQKQAAGRIFLVWQILGLETPIEALDFIGQQASEALSITDTQAILTLSNSIQRNAMVEATLRIQALVAPNRARLHPLVLMHVYEALGAVNSQDVGNDLLLQATNFWKEVG